MKARKIFVFGDTRTVVRVLFPFSSPEKPNCISAISARSPSQSSAIAVRYIGNRILLRSGWRTRGHIGAANAHPPTCRCAVLPKPPTKRKPKRKAKAARKKPTAAELRAAARDQRIAEGIVEGKSVAEIAREEGISRAWASQHANSPAVAQIITSLIQSRLERVHSLFEGALDVIEKSYVAKRIVLDRYGMQIDLGPDHYARLTGAKRFLEFALAGRAVPKEEEKGERPLTLADLKALIDEHPTVRSPLQ